MKMIDSNKKDDQVAIGIDLGTTNSCAAYYLGKFKVIEHNSDRLLPSVITYTSPDKFEVGDVNWAQNSQYQSTIITNSKRFIGLSTRDPKVIENSQNLPYEIIDNNGNAAFQLKFKDNNTKMVSPVEAALHILKQIKENAEASLKKTVTKAVVTVPAHFNYDQRDATKIAASLAGFEEIRLLTESTAAAMIYSHETNFETNGTTDKNGTTENKGVDILVFDLGGGTFDVSILNVLDNQYTVLAEEGDMHLGGVDFNACIYNHFKNKIKSTHGIDISEDSDQVRRVFMVAEDAKKTLSKETEWRYTLHMSLDNNFICPLSLTRVKFEELSRGLFQRVETTISKAVGAAKLKNPNLDISHIILVGGSSMIPYFANNLLTRMFPSSRICRDVSVESAVAFGAALHAASQFGCVTGNIAQINFSEVAPLSLGIEVIDGDFVRIIEKNTPIPVTKSQEFKTSEDNQSSIIIKVFQGERQIAAGNKLLGQLIFKIQPLPLGAVTVKVTFSISDEGILSISTLELPNRKQRNLRLENSNRISHEEIMRLREEAL